MPRKWKPFFFKITHTGGVGVCMISVEPWQGQHSNPPPHLPHCGLTLFHSASPLSPGEMSGKLNLISDWEMISVLCLYIPPAVWL